LGWNLALGLICGDVCVWKGAPSTNLSSIACTNIIHEVFKRNGVINNNSIFSYQLVYYLLFVVMVYKLVKLLQVIKEFH
jgi:hypothetical protein